MCVEENIIGHSHRLHATSPCMQLGVHGEVLNVIHDRVGEDLGVPQLSYVEREFWWSEFIEDFPGVTTFIA